MHAFSCQEERMNIEKKKKRRFGLGFRGHRLVINEQNKDFMTVRQCELIGMSIRFSLSQYFQWHQQTILPTDKHLLVRRV